MLPFLLPSCAGPTQTDTGEPWVTPYARDGELRVNHGQFIGSHNSYHVEPDNPLVVDWEYTHLPLDEQLDTLGVRQVELDVHYVADDDDFEVYHVPVFDEETTCRKLSACLEAMAGWSKRNRGHFPILVMIEPKDDLDVDKIAGHYDRLDEVIREAWSEARLLQPDDVQGEAATLGEAVRDVGWPLLESARGKAIFALLDAGEHRAAYTEDGTSLAGRVMFAEATSLDDPLAAYFKLDDPVADARAIAEAVAAGFLVRTRADSEGVEPRAGDTSRLEAALAGGGHYVSSDFPGEVEGIDYVAEIPEGTPGRCNPLTAPADCLATDIEDPALLDGKD